MYNRLKIGVKIIVLVLLLVLLSVVAESIISYYRYKDTVKSTYLTKLELISTLQKSSLDHSIGKIEANFDTLANHPIFTTGNYFDVLDTSTDSVQLEYRVIFRENLDLQTFCDLNNIQDLYILNDNSKIIYQHSDIQADKRDFHNMDNQVVDIHKSEFKVNQPVREDALKEFNTYVTSPIFSKPNHKGKLKGFFVAKFHTADFLSPLKIDSSLFDRAYKLKCYKLYQQDIFSLLSKKHPLETTNSEDDPLILSAKNGESSSGEGLYDIDERKHFAVWNYHEDIGVGIMTLIPCDAAYSQVLYDFNFYSILIGLIIIALTLLLSFFFARIITYPMLKLKKVLSLVSNGVLPKELNTPLQDEVGDMIKIVNNHVRSLKKTAAFAIKIGEGDFNTDFQPISSKDTLGQALVNMRESLRNADEKDLLRNWIVTGVAEIGEILRNNDNLSTLGDQILEYICQRINAVQGAFYVVNGDDSEETYIELKASYAYEKKKFLDAKFKFAEGLVGQAAIEQDIILRTEIPEDYMRISSGLLGDRKPSCLFIVPLITDEKVYGIVEMAGFAKFTDGHIEFMKEVSEIISRTIANVKVNEHTKKLLEQSQRMSSELQVQQEELRKNAVQMENQQVELKESNAQLEHQITEVNNAQNRIQALLENASEVITIYDEEGIIKYVSPSVEHILGYSQEDLVGINDKKFINQNHQVEFEKMFKELLTSDQETVTIQMSYFRKKGDKIWLEATGKNMLSDPAIQGIVVNSRDITERRRAEEEERKRGQMQALSENSPDLITRIDLEGRFYYLNPAIEFLTGHKPEHFLNKSLEDNDLDKSILDQWMAIVDKVKNEGKKQTAEMDFPSVLGMRIMSVNAIPEYDLDAEIESVLVVAHDITEQKAIANEIKETNIKINDSINYAELIQESILPDTKMVQETFKESFIYFRPRDVVSGDFPWFAKHGDHAYIAAVDCTGHGVPGAMISLVGYFLLNNITDGRDDLSAAEVLNRLDKLVTYTFKQDQENSKLKDGMDIAICRINVHTNLIEYAGANRPLYIMRADNQFEEIKGDKFPIGGGLAYDNKTAFTNNVVQANHGDSIYFFSDGYPDQFGGDGKTKLGPRRIRETINETKELGLDEIHQEFDQRFVNWKGEGSQTDDVLLIGIRF